MEVSNKFKTKCSDCGKMVEAHTGRAWLDAATDKWYVRHMDCSSKITAATPNIAQPTSSASPEQLDAASEKVIDLMISRFADLVPELVQDNMMAMTRTVEIVIPNLPKVKVKASHAMLPVILQAIVGGGVPFIVGPAGSGKTYLARQIADALKLDFYFAARVTSEFKLMGFVDAHGNVVRTQFREAYEHGGLFLFDEVDASDPDAMTAFNAALSNGIGDFPDGMVEMHKDFRAMAAGNTYGRGADRQYVGRNQLDAATLDRFDVFEVDYDEAFELSIAPDKEWTKHVQKVRAAVARANVRHVVSPRASIRGGNMLAAKMDRKVVEEATIWKGLDEGNRKRVEAEMGRWHDDHS